MHGCRKYLRRLSLALLVGVLPTPTPSTAGLNALVSVAEVQVSRDGAAIVVDDQSNACGGSGPTSYTYSVYQGTPTANERAMYATLTTAVASGNRVWIVADGCVGTMERVLWVSLYRGGQP